MEDLNMILDDIIQMILGYNFELLPRILVRLGKSIAIIDSTTTNQNLIKKLEKMHKFLDDINIHLKQGRKIDVHPWINKADIFTLVAHNV